MRYLVSFKEFLKKRSADTKLIDFELVVLWLLMFKV